MPGQRKLLIFVVKVLILILVLSILWPFISPSYTVLLAGTGSRIATPSVSMTAVDSSIVIQSNSSQMNMVIHTLPFQAGLLLLLALIIATPRIKLRQRLLYIVIGAVFTFILHISSVLIMTVNVRAIRPLVVLFASVGIDLFPVLVWIVLSSKYWWPRRGASPSLRTDEQTIVPPSV